MRSNQIKQGAAVSIRLTFKEIILLDPDNPVTIEWEERIDAVVIRTRKNSSTILVATNKLPEIYDNCVLDISRPEEDKYQYFIESKDIFPRE